MAERRGGDNPKSGTNICWDRHYASTQYIFLTLVGPFLIEIYTQTTTSKTMCRSKTVFAQAIVMMILMAAGQLQVGDSFTLQSSGRAYHHQQSGYALSISVNDQADDMQGPNVQGDALRAATGIRPSLHPTTINAIAEALKIRASDSDPNTPLKESDIVKPLDVALSAGKIAAKAIEKRQTTSTTDGMALMPEEGQAIAGRVVGVVMRLDELEQVLFEKVSKVGWVKKYDAWATFGLLEDPDAIQDRIRADPLFSLCRAECLLALFLHTVEAPQMEKIGQAVPGGSTVDFLDAERQEVLLECQ